MSVTGIYCKRCSHYHNKYSGLCQEIGTDRRCLCEWVFEYGEFKFKGQQLPTRRDILDLVESIKKTQDRVDAMFRLLEVKEHHPELFNFLVGRGVAPTWGEHEATKSNVQSLNIPLHNVRCRVYGQNCDCGRENQLLKISNAIQAFKNHLTVTKATEADITFLREIEQILK